MIAKEMCSDYEDLFEQLDELIRIATINNDKTELVAKMKDLVPEYVSMNSHFEQLDN